MMEKFPIDGAVYSLVIVDLFLHYFDNNTTVHIMNEIKRIKKNNVILLLRIVVINDFNFGAGVGEKFLINKITKGSEKIWMK